MKAITLTLLAASLAACLGAGAQTTQRLTASKANEYALIYTLPLTGLEVTLQASSTVETPGPLALYSKKLLGVEPVLQPSTRWSLTAAQIVPTAYPDADERWQVQFKGGQGVTMTLTPEGYPLAVNADVEAPAREGVTLTAEAALPTILELPVAGQAVTEDMQRASSSAKRAELAAARIFEIRESRAELIAGQADNMPPDGAALKLALDNLADQEAALSAMFAGTRATATAVETYRADLPMADEPTRFVVARLSPTLGLLPADDLRGAPIYLSVTDIVTAELPLDEKGQEKAFPKGGLAYRIPGSAVVTVEFDGRRVASRRVDVAQYGVVFGLNPALFTDKKEPTAALFAPLTGAVTSLGPR